MGKIQSIFTRYLIAIILGLKNFYILSAILTPLTITPIYRAIKLITPTTLIDTTIQTQTLTIEIIPACIAVSAYYLLIFLFLATPNISTKTRIYTILTATASLLALNIIRILILSTIATQTYFETIHWITWHIISTILVVAIYITTIRLYKIKSIPVYDDFKYLRSLTKKPKSRKHKKKKSRKTKLKKYL